MLIRDLPNHNAVKFGKLFIKADQVEKSISRVCRLLLLESTDDSLPLGRIGSCTLFGWQSVHFVVLTRHQLDVSPGSTPTDDILETIRIATGNTHVENIPLEACFFETSHPNEEYHDLLIFRVSNNWKNPNLDRPYFLPLVPTQNKRRLASYVVGIPSVHPVMENYLAEHFEGRIGPVKNKPLVCGCQFDDQFRSQNEYLFRFRTELSEKFYDGLSGGAVISVFQNIDGYEVALDGIILRGGNGYIHAIDSAYMMKILRKT